MVTLFVICVITVFAANQNITKKWITNDGVDNYKAAYRLLEGKPLLQRREPLPPVFLAAWLYAAFPTFEDAALNKVNGKPEIMRAKRHNLAWALLIVLSAYVATLLLTGSAVAALVAAGLSSWSVSMWSQGLDTMYTEPAAAALLMLTSVAAIVVAQRQTLWGGTAFGVLFGGLALTKAIALPIFFVAGPLLGLLAWIGRREWKRATLLLALSIAAFAATVGPWMTRSAATGYSVVDDRRGAEILYYRMLIDEMPPETYRAAFYVWAPPQVRPALEKLFGFTPADIEKGGAGQWLNRAPKTSFFHSDREAQKLGRPDLASTYSWKLRAEHAKRWRELAANGVPHAQGKATRSMLDEAKERILGNLSGHFAALAPLAWQGMWVDNAPYWLSPLLTLSLPILLIWAAFAGRPDAFAFGMVPFGFFAVYLLATHNLPRYVTPVVPAMYVSFVVLAYVALVYGCRRWKRRAAAKEAAIIEGEGGRPATFCH
jgi:hypothetical protein